MIIGSHNTMSYLKPDKWYLRLFRFMSQCQDEDLLSQFMYGARLFDLRLCWDKNNECHFVHGVMTFSNKETNPENIFDLLNILSDGDEIWVRVICERQKDNERFIEYCKELQAKYPNLKLYGGRDKKTWKVLYDFGNGEPNTIDKYSSWNNDTKLGTGWHLDDLFPRIYAISFNKMWRKKLSDFDGYLLQDFVGIY